MKRGNRVPAQGMRILVLGIGIAFSIPMNAGAASDTAFASLLIFPSPAANAMGNASGGAADDSPLAVMMNPALLGMSGRRNVFATEYYPQKIQWQPSPAPGMDYDAKSTAFCLSLRPVRGIRLSMGIGIYGSRLNLGRAAQANAGLPDTTGDFIPWEQVNGTAVSVTFEHIAAVSLGYTLKSLQANPEPGVLARSATHDFGLALKVPVFRLLKRSRAFNPMEDLGTFEPFLDPGFYFSRSNIDGHAPVTDADRSGLLPRNHSLGFHVSAGLRYRTGWSGFSPLSLKWVHEKSNPSAVSRRGLEIGFMDFYFYRTGRVEDREGGSVYETRGYGINFLQPARILAALLEMQDSRLFRLISAVSFEKHFSKTVPERDSPPYGVRFSSYVIRLGGLVMN